MSSPFTPKTGISTQINSLQYLNNDILNDQASFNGDTNKSIKTFNSGTKIKKSKNFYRNEEQFYG